VTRLWCELAWLGGERAEAGVLLELEGERITAVTPGVPAPAGTASGGTASGGTPSEGNPAQGDPTAPVQRLRGLTLPGLANAHSHAFQRALRGRTHAGTGSFWTWREQMYELAERLDPDSCFALSRAAFGEMALAGITCVGEFHYLHHAPDGTPYDDPNAMGRAVLAAAQEAGLRITLLDACYLHGGIARFRDRDADAWGQRVEAIGERPAARVGAAIHSVRAVDPGAARTVAEWARERPLHAHVSEQPKENEDCLAAHGRTPTALLADAGALSERFTAVHATHLADDDVALLGGAAVTACLCPTTERDLADGIGPARRLVEAGASLATGSDSHAVVDPFEEARAIELDERLATGVRGVHRAPELLRAATAGGCASLGWPDGGRLEPGALADLVIVSLDSVRLAGTAPEHAAAAAVFAATAADVRDVMVGGRWIVRDGEHAAFDVAAALRRTLDHPQGGLTP
jgi:formiminoglutamate deiminase